MKEETYDAIVIGAGPNGEWMAKGLSEGGLRVLIVDAGPVMKESDFARTPKDGILQRAGFFLGGHRRISAAVALNTATSRFYVDERQNPYTNEAVQKKWPHRPVIPVRVLGYAHGPVPPMLQSALNTGRAELRPSMIVDHILTDSKNGRVGGISCIETSTGKRIHFHGGMIVCCASSIRYGFGVLRVSLCYRLQ